MRRHHGVEKHAGAQPMGVAVGVASPQPLPTRPLQLRPQPLAPTAAQDGASKAARRDMFGRVVPSAKGHKRGASSLGPSAADAHAIRFKYQVRL